MTRVDLHCHTKYSEHPAEWFLKRLGAAESYTEPEQLYKILLKEGMDFVTITDHNRIDGALLLKKRYPEKVIVGLEATAYFPEDGCKIHVLVFGLNELQFEEIQKLRHNIYKLRDYLKDNDLAHSVAHATYSVNGKLNITHLEKLILLFDVFEGINGGREIIHNNIWIEMISSLTPQTIANLKKKYDIEPFSDTPWIKGLTGGSDDHANLFAGKTHTQSSAININEFLQEIKAKRTSCGGRHNNYKALAFTLYKIAYEYTNSKNNSFLKTYLAQIPSAILADSTNKLGNLKFLNKRNKQEDEKLKLSFNELVSILNNKKMDTETKLPLAYNKVSDMVDTFAKTLITSFSENIEQGNILKIFRNLTSSLTGIFFTLPFYSTLLHMNSNRKLLKELSNKYLPRKIDKHSKILWFTDTITEINSASGSLKSIEDISMANDLELIIVSSSATKPAGSKFINLENIAQFNLPYRESITLKLPSMLKAIDLIAEAKPDKIIASTPGPIGLLGLLASKLLQLPFETVYHDDFSGFLVSQKNINIVNDDSSASLMNNFVSWFYQQSDVVFAPSEYSFARLVKMDIPEKKLKVFPRGIDYDKFYPVNYGRAFLIDSFQLKSGKIFLYTGSIDEMSNLEILLEAFCRLRDTIKDSYLILAGDGPALNSLRERYGNSHIKFAGNISRNLLPNYYSGADLLLYPCQVDSYAMQVLEAQACCLPAAAIDQSGTREIIEHNQTGFLVEINCVEAWYNTMFNFYQLCKNNPDKVMEMKRKSRRNIQLKWNWSNFIDTFAS